MNLINKRKIMIMIIMLVVFTLCSFAFAANDEYNITFIDNCGRACIGTDELSKAEEGQELAIWFNPYYAPQNKALDHWIIDEEDTNIDSQFFYFEMPDHDVTFEVAYVDAITSIEISGDFDFSNPDANDEIPLINASVTKVNGGKALLNKVNLVYAKWVNVTNYIPFDSANGYIDFIDPETTYFINGDRYIFVYKLETTDPDYAFSWYDTEITIVTPTETIIDDEFVCNFKDTSSHVFLTMYNEIFVTVEEGYHSVVFYLGNGSSFWNEDHRVCVVSDNDYLDPNELYNTPSIDEYGYSFDYWEDYWDSFNEKTSVLSEPITDNIAVKARFSEQIVFPTWEESSGVSLSVVTYTTDDYIPDIQDLDEY